MKARGASALSALVLLALLATVVLAWSFYGCGSPGIPEEERSGLILATTTSVLDSGLLDELVLRFEERYPYRMKTVAVGSGAALLMARQGEADVSVTHEPKAEKEFMDAGYGESRREVMYNDFIIVGPSSDPAGIRGMTDAADAFARISGDAGSFLSRGDASGTHAMEMSVWERAGIQPGGDWYRESGQGMGYTLRIAEDEGAYTLTDRATFIVLDEALDLEVMVEGDAGLLNVYSVIVTNPAVFPDTNIQGARDFDAFLFEEGTQEFIDGFGVERYGRHLFYVFD
ncbi:MAG: substrate-binding domain-containing protein [Actinomycetota bacterium]|nr:substrate-binding domain-containing protein [Actinomycetota bacterium]MDD5667073.1 substrate-binding domain-containing protein [Actinomycetota bacterium]